MQLITHVTIAVLIGGWIYSFYPSMSFFVILIAASVIPDLDTQLPFVKHRGCMHSLTFSAIFAFLASFAFKSAFVPFFIGYGSHLFSDSFTIWGTKPFWPIRFEIKGPLRVGSLSEKILRALIFTAIAAFLLLKIR